MTTTISQAAAPDADQTPRADALAVPGVINGNCVHATGYNRERENGIVAIWLTSMIAAAWLTGEFTGDEQSLRERLVRRFDEAAISFNKAARHAEALGVTHAGDSARGCARLAAERASRLRATAH